jgi:thymidine kinase
MLFATKIKDAFCCYINRWKQSTDESLKNKTLFLKVAKKANLNNAVKFVAFSAARNTIALSAPKSLVSLKEKIEEEEFKTLLYEYFPSKPKVHIIFKNINLLILLSLLSICSYSICCDRLTVITGPMYSGKSKMLIELASLLRARGKVIASFKPSVDTRNSYIVSRGCTEQLPCFMVNSPYCIIYGPVNHTPDAVFIDEAQFFSDDLVAVIHKIISRRIQVFIAALDMDYRGVPFGSSMGAICQMADRVIKLKARCSSCNKLTAVLTQRLKDGKPSTSEESRVVIEGTDGIIYEPRCRDCHIYE